MSNGCGGSTYNGPGMRLGSPVPKYLLDRSVVDAKALSTTFWEVQP
jgi:hypothetical protein